MPKCSNGHEQKLGLKCATCGAAVSYMDSLQELLTFPEVHPDYGKIAVLSVGLNSPWRMADFSGVVARGESANKDESSFTVASIGGGTWSDYLKKADELRSWLKLVVFEGSKHRFLVMDTADPLSVMAVASVPEAGGTVVLAIAADEESTPVEQNTSYAAIATALERGLPVLIFTQALQRDVTLLEDGRAFVTNVEAMPGVVGALLESGSEVADLLQRDLKFGVRAHYASAIMSGSKKVYGNLENALAAQYFQVPEDVRPDEVKTIYPIAYMHAELEAELEKSFSRFRGSKFKSILSAEFRSREKPDPTFFDLLTIYGVSDEVMLRRVTEGYDEVSKRVPELKMGGVK